MDTSQSAVALPALFQSAFAAHREGRLSEAEEGYRRVLAIDGNHADACHLLGTIEIGKGRNDAAEALIRRALAVREDAYFLANLGTLLKESGRVTEAEACYRRALALRANMAEVHDSLGAILLESERFAEAEENLQRALALRRDLPETYASLGLLFQKTNRPDEAEAAYRSALALNPDFVSVHNNLGTLFAQSKRFAEAEKSYRCALALRPDFVAAHANLAQLSLPGNAYPEGKRLPEAATAFRNMLENDPNNPEGRLHNALLLLQTGDFLRGWKEYEYRWQTKGTQAPHYAQPLWLGEQDLHGKTILLHAEQGYGDTLQFIRYTSLVAARGARIYLLVPQALVSLAVGCAGVDAVFATGDALPAFDYHCPLMSLPLACGTELSTIPKTVPYLHPDKALVGQWREKLGTKNALRVGLTWTGDPRKYDAWALSIDSQRSIRFAQLQPLLALSGIEFFSLQIGADAVAQLQGNTQVKDLTAGLRDFQDTAALIENLDLVISVDTSVAHLAGALGKPVWLLNRYNTCWRWLMQRADSPWYPSMQIFRQTVLGDWDGVIEQVKRALEGVRDGGK